MVLKLTTCCPLHRRAGYIEKLARMPCTYCKDGHAEGGAKPWHVFYTDVAQNDNLSFLLFFLLLNNFLFRAQSPPGQIKT